MVNNFSVKNLIEFWGSIRQFAEEVGCSYEAARKMRDRNSISPKYWNIIIQLSQSKGLSWITINWFLHTYENKSRKIYFPMTKHHKDAVYSAKNLTVPDGSQLTTSTFLEISTDNEHQQNNSSYQTEERL
ncbi:hypothetical protein [Bartonella schoenbuchensis]|uniref:DNA-binding protein n=2 Tax=Bartonella schoenbuchensis TaxID=165694 RepID=E6Z0W4_BARSR|nr:hypothetical protein [Bartonella schoenbuchensis]AQX31146.1 hypothetical protein BscR1v2_012320 [Bartonella schoenbuchensis R1]ENN91044.1 putative DNA-binding protein [Bartonella schoenbuchensis m07a]CBI82752.1 conserved hypothetical protein [Bartonella schoenbuchensis R1]